MLLSQNWSFLTIGHPLALPLVLDITRLRVNALCSYLLSACFTCPACAICVISHSSTLPLHSSDKLLYPCAAWNAGGQLGRREGTMKMSCGTSEPGSSGVEGKAWGPTGSQLCCQLLSLVFSILNKRMKWVLSLKTSCLMFILSWPYFLCRHLKAIVFYKKPSLSFFD